MSRKLSSAIIVVIATVFTTIAQLSFKLGADAPGFVLLSFPINLMIVAGFVSYGIAALLFVHALRGGELSLLYPIWALSFVWVFLVSLFVLQETILAVNWIGIVLIIIGVSFIGREAKHG